MNIFIYWNYKDGDSKKIYSFLNDSEFIESVKEREDIVFHKEFENFELTEEIVKEIEGSDVILFFTHGDSDAILKFRYKDPLLKQRFVFIDKGNASILKKKKVIAICCNSARELGNFCMNGDIKSEFYIGFADDITYDEGFTNDFKSIVYKTYSKAFSEVVLNAYKGHWSADKFVKRLRKNISDMMTDEILKANLRLGSSGQATFHKKTANSLLVLGNAEALVFA